jgi:Abnormal spindle-like microcephaly-assoc'd, ASPM-SPD-2-Hydin/Kelch motif/Galactose oxidase, central domain
MVRVGYRRTVSSALIPFAFLIATLFGTIAASVTPAAAAGLTVTAGVAFGNVVFGVSGATSVARSVKITNPLTGQPVTGLTVQLSGAEQSEFTISNNGCGSTLAKGTFCTVMLTFTPAALGTRGASLAVSDTANANAGSSALSGVGVTGKLTITPLTSAFGSLLVGNTSAAKTTTLKNPNTVALHITSVAPSGEFGISSDTCTGNDLAAGATCAIGATFSPMQTGALTGHLTITDDATGSPQSTALSGSGILAPPTFSSPSIPFGKVLVSNSSAATSITLTNDNILPLQITSITTSGPFGKTTNCGPQVNPFVSCQISVSFDPTIAVNPAGTTETGKLVVVDNATPGSQSVGLSGVAYGVTISGSAIQNGMNGAEVTAVTVNANGSDGTILRGVLTDSNGNFSMVIAKQQAGPVRFRTSGGSYVSEQDGATISSPSPISVLLPSMQNNLLGLEINPLTTFVDSLAQGNISRGQLLATALTNSRTSIEHDYGITTDPAALPPQYAAAAIGTDAGRLGLILGALVNEDELACPASPGALVTALSSDISDGAFDGKKSGTPVSYCGGSLYAIAGTAGFGDALSGLQQLALATSGFAFGGINNELSLNGVTPDDVAADVATIEEALVAAAPTSFNFFALTTPVMNVPRYLPMATLLPNGKVLIAGGNNGPSILSSAELYDPSTNTFAVAASTPVMNIARENATATLLPNGKVLIAGGGGTFSNFLSSTELYDPVSNTFVAAPSMNVGRYYATATLLSNGKVLIAGGQGSVGHLSSTELYDPVSNTFAASTPAMNTARAVPTATLLPNGKVLIAGGAGDAGPLTSTELYDPTTNTFAAAAVMNDGRYYATATLLPSGRVLIAGGFDGNNNLTSTELYDPVSNTFAASTPMMNIARSSSTMTLLPNGKVLIAGGGNALSSTELYDPVANTFAASTPAMNTGRGGTPVATLLPNGKVLIAGGIAPGSVILNSTELYTP